MMSYVFPERAKEIDPKSSPLQPLRTDSALGSDPIISQCVDSTQTRGVIVAIYDGAYNDGLADGPAL